MKGECCEKCRCPGFHPRDEQGNSYGHDGICHNHDCPCHRTHTEVDRIVQEFNDEFEPQLLKSASPHVEWAPDVKNWLRAKLTQFQSSIEQSVVEAHDKTLADIEAIYNTDKTADYRDIVANIRAQLKAFKKE